MVGERGEARVATAERKAEEGGSGVCARARQRDPGHVEPLWERRVYY
jgi:hypothetical protein